MSESAQPLSRRERREMEEAARMAEGDATQALPVAPESISVASRRERRRMERLAHPVETWTAEEEMIATGQMPAMTPDVIAEHEQLARENAAAEQADAAAAYAATSPDAVVEARPVVEATPVVESAPVDETPVNDAPEPEAAVATATAPEATAPEAPTPRQPTRANRAGQRDSCRSAAPVPAGIVAGASIRCATGRGAGGCARQRRGRDSQAHARGDGRNLSRQHRRHADCARR